MSPEKLPVVEKEVAVKLIRHSLFTFVLAIIILVIALIFPHKTLGNWYAGFDSGSVYNGISALISAPQNPLHLIQSESSGESNWVSSHDVDEYGFSDWIQAGWLIYWWDNKPWQYYEICVDCLGENYGFCLINSTYANHEWGMALTYQVYKSPTDNQCCADTGGAQRYCYWAIHENPVHVYAKSEIHIYSSNSLDTWFSQVKFKDPNNGNWYLFTPNDVDWAYNFPYREDNYYNQNDFYFHTYRVDTNDVFLPLISNQ